MDIIPDLKALISYLMEEKAKRENGNVDILPDDERILFRRYRAMVNTRPPMPAPDWFFEAERRVLSERLDRRGVIGIDGTTLFPCGVRLWQGDITRLGIDGIVNAANSRMQGCFIACHNCIDNIIHTNAGIMLRRECARVSESLGGSLGVGCAAVTGGYNLPCRYVIHTVGPRVEGSPEPKDMEALSDCYKNCIIQAKAFDMRSLAFCCISTGEFSFPRRQAAEIAIDTVLKEKGGIEVVFDVYTDEDYRIYKEILAKRSGI